MSILAIGHYYFEETGRAIDHFSVMGLVAWPLSGSEVEVEVFLYTNLGAFQVKMKNT